MALPQAIAAQVEQAESIQQQLYAEGQAAPEAQPAPETPVAETPSNVVELPKQAEPVPQAPQPRADAREDDAGYWRDRFKTVQGKLDAEMPQLYHRLRELDQQNQQLIAKLTERTEHEQSRETPTTSKDAENFGDDMLEMIDRRATTIAQRLIEQATAALSKDVGAVREQVGRVSEDVVETKADRFWNSVITLVPDWKQIDTDPRWIEWLDTAPVFSEASYRDLAGQAIAKGNAQKVATLVEVWKKETGLTAPETPQPTRQQQVKAELTRQVTPNTAKAGTTPSPTTEKIWSKEEFEAAMDVRNTARLGQKEADRLEAEANRAVAEGRVRW